MIKLLIFKPELEPRSFFEKVNRKCRPWLVKYKRDYGPDHSIYRYIQKYHNDKVTVHFKKPYQVKNINEYDYIYPGTEFWNIPIYRYYYGKQKSDKYVKLLKSISKKKLLLPYEYFKFGTDKCIQNKLLTKIKIPVVLSKCYPTKSKYSEIYRNIKKLRYGNLIIKPMPAAESHDIFKSKNHNNVFTKEYYDNVKKYDKIIVQKYMKNFASERYPEIRTFWVGNKFILGVKTTTQGYYKSSVKKLPSVIRYHTQRLINFIEKKFKMKFIFARIDWGYDRSKGYFFNEIEILPGMFVEDYNKEFKRRCAWNVDKLIAERLVQVIS